VENAISPGGSCLRASTRSGRAGTVGDNSQIQRGVPKFRSLPANRWFSKTRTEFWHPTGLTDRGIAQRLYVTPKTVETHVRHIFQKLSLPESALANKRVRAVLTYLRA
jgi:hypothetical protein